MSINNNLNDNKSSFISPLEQKDVDDLTKNFHFQRDEIGIA